MKACKRIAIALENIALQLRVLNEGRDQFYREVLGVLTEASNRGVKCPAVYQGNDYSRHQCAKDNKHDGRHQTSWGQSFDLTEGPSGAGATAQVVEKEGP